MKKKPILLVLFLSFYTFILGQVDEPYTASYIMEWGNKDTIAIETFTLYKNQIYGKAVHGFPENYVRHFDIEYDENGSIAELNYLYNDVSNTSLPVDTKTGFLPYRFSAKLHDDLLDFKILRKPRSNTDSDENTGFTRIVHQTKGYHFNGDWIPIISQFEWLVSWFLERNVKKVEGLKFINAYIGIHELQLERIDKNHIRFWSNISEAIEIFIDDDGRIETIDAIGSVWNLNIIRIDPIDIEHYTNSFKDRPTMGNPSPRETVSQKIGATTITIDYGRPSKRGRKIFGNIVPYGKIWRTGAGSATTISFDNDIYFGDQKVRAGKYSMHSLPTQDSFTLILNSNLDAWGSVYLPEFDVVHIPLSTGKTDTVTEKFTIEIKEIRKGGTLQLKWDFMQASFDFR